MDIILCRLEKMTRECGIFLAKTIVLTEILLNLTKSNIYSHFQHLAQKTSRFLS